MNATLNKTSIEWCDFTVNPIRFRPHDSQRTVTMCQKVSPGCKHCYAESITRRFWPKDAATRFMGYTLQGVQSGEFVLDEAKLSAVLKHKQPCRIFWGDMTDLFAEWVKDNWLDQIAVVCTLTPQITHMFLTKRAERMRDYWRAPLPNVWLGVSVEDQKQADERIPLLLQTSAAVRFISAEPLLGSIDLRGALLDWVIVGSESGQNARPMREQWVRSLRDQCAASAISFFYKQRLDARGHKVATPLLDDTMHVQFPRCVTSAQPQPSTRKEQHVMPATIESQPTSMRQQIEELVDCYPLKPSMFDSDGSLRRRSIIRHIESMVQECHLQFADLELLDVATATIDLKLAVHRTEMLKGIVIPRDRLIPPSTEKPLPAQLKKTRRFGLRGMVE